MTISLQTTVTTKPSARPISHEDRVMLIGSCFSDEIGARMAQAGMQVLSNPMGTLYNPMSIAESLRRAIEGNGLESSEIFLHDGLWHSWLHHGSFSKIDRSECLQLCNSRFDTTRQWLQASPIVIITFGTAYVFYRKGKVVGNCHKMPAGDFERRRLTIEEIVQCYRPLLKHLTAIGARIIFTVSPIRHMADGAHGNQLSKSILLLAIDEMTRANEGVEYFPSYEIVTDELRDYRFYADDMVHPTSLAVDIVWQRWQETYMTPATRQECLNRSKEYKRTQHRPLH